MGSFKGNFFFNLETDLYIGFVYISPQNSISTRDLSENAWNDLEKEYIQFMNRGKVLLMGDQNARTGQTELDYVDMDDNVYTPVSDQYVSDSAMKRNNMDKYANEYGKRLHDFCKHAGARILNGRCMGDLNGHFTCFQWNGSSTVDYCIAQENLLQSIQFFKVHEFRGLLSNHCKISIHFQQVREFI